MSKNKKLSKIKVSIAVVLMLLPSGSTPVRPVDAGLQPPAVVCTAFSQGAST